MVVASNGSPVSRTEFDGYGVEIPILAGANSALRYAGKHGYYKDDSSGLNLLGQRFYSARLGRFLTQDPIGHSGGLNLYAYCDNSPLTNVDPSGTSPDRKLTVVLGSTAGKDEVAITQYFERFYLPNARRSAKLLGYDLEVLRQPSKKQFMTALVTSTSLMFCGHGRPRGSIDINESKSKAEAWFEFSDFQKAFKLRSDLGLGPITGLALDACEVFQNRPLVRFLKEKSTHLRGFRCYTMYRDNPFYAKPEKYSYGRMTQVGTYPKKDQKNSK